MKTSPFFSFVSRLPERVLTFACFSSTYPVAIPCQYVVWNPNLGVLADVIELGRGGEARRPDTVFFCAPWVCLAAVTLVPTTTGSDSWSPQSWRPGLPSGIGRQPRRAEADRASSGVHGQTRACQGAACGCVPGDLGLLGSCASWLGFQRRLTAVAQTRVPGAFCGSRCTWQPCPATSLACASGQVSFS